MSIHAGTLSNPEFLAELSHELAGSTAVAVVVVGADLRIEDINPAAEEMMGGILLPGTGLSEVLAEPAVTRLREALASGAAVGDPLVLRCATQPGDLGRALIASIVRVGDPARLVIIGRSAASDLRREARILRAQRYEIVGQLTSGVAHDLNNRLSTVTTFSDLMLGDAEPGSQDAEDLAEIKRAGLEAASITRKLDLFAGGHAGGATESSLPEVVRGFEKLIRRFVGSSVTLVTELDDDCPPVPAPPIRIEEVLIALVSNARDAMSGSGTLTIRAYPEGTGTAVLEVHDTGAEDLSAPLEQALELFYSTKTALGGTGLGLTTIGGILTTLGGSIEMSRAEGDACGTCVRIELPAISKPATDGAEDEDAQGALAGMRVAVVEPDDKTRGALERGLSRTGALVTCFADVADLLGADAPSWDAVVADVPDHPGAGDALLHAVRRDGGTLPMVLLRRRASPLSVAPDTSFVRELAKPVDLDMIRAALASLVTGSTLRGART